MNEETTDSLAPEAASIYSNKSEYPEDASGYQSTIKQKKKREGGFCQYNKSGKNFFPAGATVDKLDPGIYKIRVINQTLAFQKQVIYTDKLLRLDDSVSDFVIGEIEEFWKMRPLFEEFAFTYKRGFLLHGPPGGGKTTTLSFVMNDVVKRGGVAVIVDQHPSTVSAMLKELRGIEPETPCVVVLEDIDTLIRNYGEADVLAMLDGESTIDNVVYIATTNYPEDLDGRIKNRPSRFDRVLEVGLPSPRARFQYLESRNLKLTEKEMDKWVEQTDGFTIAQIKEVIIAVKIFKESVADVVKRLNDMKKTPTSSGNKNKVGFGSSSERKAGFASAMAGE